MKSYLPTYLLLVLFLTACNEGSLLDEALSPDNAGEFNCIYQDCVSEVNPLLLETSSFAKNSVPLEGLQMAYDKEFVDFQDQWNFERDGYPAWDHLRSITINNSFAQYLVPVFKAEDDRVKALILFTHYFDHGVVDVEYVHRAKVSRYPTYNSLLLAGKGGTMPLRDHTTESLVVKFSTLDQSLFGSTYDDLLSLLDDETRNSFYNKDCKITTHYLLLDCQDVTGGGNILYTDCTPTGIESVTTVVSGCGGGTLNPGGPTGPTTGGGGTGGGVNVVNTDPNSRDNRCLEDEVNCEEEENRDEDIFPPDCESFPFQINTSYTSRIAGTHLVNFHYHNFSPGGDRVGYRYHTYTMDLIYFTAPLSMTNGEAATLTANAITTVNTRLEDVFGYEGWGSGGANAIEAFIMRELTQAMNVWGGIASLQSNGAVGNQIGMYGETWLPSNCN
jgi:hypothetical protein